MDLRAAGYTDGASLPSLVHKRQFVVKRETPPGQTAQLIALPVSLLSAENQLQERCTALLKGDFSNFISIGRGGTEAAPEELKSTF